MLKAFLQTRRDIYFFAFLVLFLIFSRFFLLNQLPATLPHDEMVYAIQAQSFVLQGKTLDQQQSFFSLKPSHPMYAEWPAQVMSLGFLLTDQPLLATHLVSALMGVTLPFLLALFAWQIWQKPGLAKATFVVFVFSPLFWQMSRVSYDAFYGLWFYVVGGVFLLSRKPWLVLVSALVFTIGFFQYQGFKLLLVPWILFVLGLYLTARLPDLRLPVLWQEIKRLRHRWLLVLFGLGLMACYGLVLLPQSRAAMRLDGLIFTDYAYLTQIVNDERRLSLSNPFASAMSNKVTAIVVFMLQRLVGVFNPTTLLILLEPNVSGFSVWTHGAFYWAEILLAIIGLVMLFSKRQTRLSGVVLLVGILTLCLPALINTGNEWYLLRSLFSYLLVTLSAAYGLWQLWQWRSARWLLVGLYILSVVNFSYHYWYRYPIISLDWGNFDERVLARYLDLTVQAEPEREIIVYSPEPEYDFWAYLLYNQFLTAETADDIGEAMRLHPPFSNEAEYRFGKITFSSFCAPSDREVVQKHGQTATSQPLLIVRNHHKTCPVVDKLYDSEAWFQAKKKLPSLSISAVLDSGERMQIYGDVVCAAEATTFIHVQQLTDLAIEQQTTSQFCQKFIKNLHLVQ